MNLYECCLRAIPEGSDSASRLALSSRRLGFSGVVICNHTGFEKVFRPEAAAVIKNIDVAFGTEVVAANSRALRSRVSGLRSAYPFIAVHGGSEEMNRAACEDPNVDVLMHPDEGRKALSIASARAALQNQVAIGFDLSPMMRLRGPPRARWLETIARNLVLVRKFDLPVMITSGPRSHLDLRAPRDLIALAGIAGFEEHEARQALIYPGRVLHMNMKTWAAAGVEVL